ARQVAPRPGMAEPGDRTDDQPWVPAEQVRRRQAEAAGAVGTEVLQEDVAAFDKAAKEALPLRTGEVDGDGALAAVARKVIGAESAEERRAPFARLVAIAGALDLDDVRAEVAEDLSAERAGEHARGVQDADAGQGSVR